MTVVKQICDRGARGSGELGVMRTDRLEAFVAEDEQGLAYGDRPPPPSAGL